MRRIHILLASLVFVPFGLLGAHAAEDWQQRLSAAKPGDTVTLPAGSISGGLSVPSGVRLKGAGVDKTVIDAQGGAHGIAIDGVGNASLSDLTVCNARGPAVVINRAHAVTVSSVRATGSITGVQFSGVKQGRIENCISDHNDYGIVVNSGTENVVVNSTVADCLEMGISLAASSKAVVFNNCVAGSAIALNIDDPAGLHVDCNLYFGKFVGQMKQQTSRRNLTAWQYLTKLDAHSVQLPVKFKDADGGEFTSSSVLPWALDRATTAGWGAAEFAGARAPAKDVFGNARSSRPDVGAVETKTKPSRSADGRFSVSSDSGVKSAGVFTRDGILVAYLFHNLPLPKGEYSFWLPPRDYLGQPIPAGDYEVRLAESDFKWTYLNHIADNGGDESISHSASRNPEFVAFAPRDLVVIQEGPSEDHTGIRAYETASGKLRWYVHGCTYSQGLTVGKDGMVYYLYASDRSKGESRLTKVDSATGKIVAFPGSNYGHVYPILSPTVRSLAALGDRLYAADEENNKLFVISMADGKLEKTLEVPAPKCVAGDETSDLLWIASGGSMVALSPDGAKVAESKAVAEPIAATVHDGKIAVASAKSGKVHVFDASDPKNLKSLREVGRGDGPYGALAGDRFVFQRPDSSHDSRFVRTSVSLDAKGRLAAVDNNRLLVLDNRGQPMWHTIGVFGNMSPPSHATNHRRFWDTEGTLSFRLNEKDGTWKSEGYWDHVLISNGSEEQKAIFLGDFALGDKTFGVFAHWPLRGKSNCRLLTVARLDAFKAVPVLRMSFENGKAVSRTDSNGDGEINEKDTAKPLVDAQGQSLAPNIVVRFMYLQHDGSIISMAGPPTIWKCAGLDANGVPIYEGKDYGKNLFHANWRKDLSPFDFKDDFVNCGVHGGHGGGNGFVAAGLLSDGGSVIQAFLRNSGGSPGNNGAGTDLCGYAPDGRRRWVHQLAPQKGIAGMGTADDITITAVHSCLEILAVDADGLGLGGFCEAPQLRYPGYWIDHPNLRLFKMPDGNLYATNGDNCNGRHPWYRLDNRQSLKKETFEFRLDELRVKQLAALEWKPAAEEGRPPPPTVRIPRLAKPLPIDGSLEKWRAAGIQPVITMKPSGRFDGPGDCSGVIRMAYEGQNLYFQVLQFDDSPTFHQRNNMFQQNAVELALNGTFPNGFQFIVYKNPDGQDMIHRHRFFQRSMPAIKIPQQHAPRVVRVLPSAEKVIERTALEQLYGVDLSEAKVIVTEFMLPMNQSVYTGAEDDAIELGPGKQFWVGFFLDDNDHLYTDKQEIIAWPASFGMFSPKEEGAIAICE